MNNYISRQPSPHFLAHEVSGRNGLDVKYDYSEAGNDQRNPNRLKPVPFCRETSFVEYCAFFLQRMSHDRSVFTDFPLKGKLRLRSNISLACGAGELQDINIRRVENKDETTLWLNILTLGGNGGGLPFHVSEDIQRERRNGGDALHQFLDLINRRFWELFFQSYRIGTRPQFGFNNPSARWLIHDLAKNTVGFGNTTMTKDITATLHQGYLLRYCFNVGHGSGTSSALAELLSRGIERPVSIVEQQPCNALIPWRHTCCLHSIATRDVTRSFGMLGRHAIVHKLRILDIQGEANDLYLFLPVAEGLLLQVLLKLLTMALAGELSLVALRYKAILKAGDSWRLGEKMLRLGWGGALGARGSCCNFIHVSATAIARNGEIK